jgi:hypothetical protein
MTIYLARYSEKNVSTQEWELLVLEVIMSNSVTLLLGQELASCYPAFNLMNDVMSSNIVSTYVVTENHLQIILCKGLF